MDDEDFEEDEGYDDFEDDEDDRLIFADPGGRSALRAVSKDNPRNLPCPNCGEPNRLMLPRVISAMLALTARRDTDHERQGR